MEEYLTFGLLSVMGLILALLIRSITKMYERLWNSHNTEGKLPQNPEELFIIMREAMNEANKRQEDRYRKRQPRSSVDTEEETPGVARPEALAGAKANDVDAKVEAMWQQYKEMGGE